MNRTTFILPIDLKERAARRARAMGISLGEFVRKALADALKGTRYPLPGASDSLLRDRAVFSGPAPTDLAESHDSVLYGPDE